MEHIRAASLADSVFERLEEDILSGKLHSGTVLTELGISNELNVSRTPVREAIRRLEQEGLLAERGKGVVVLGIGTDALADIYEIRSRIEGLAAKKCAECITDEQLTELENIVELQEFYTIKKNSDSIKNTDTEFHKKIYEFCGSEVYSSMLSELHKKVAMYRKRSVENEKRAVLAQKEHRAILDALRAHDGDLAEELVKSHVLNALESILTAING